MKIVIFMKNYLSEVTFIIALKIDSNDRLENINIIINYLQTNFITNIILIESGNSSHQNQFEFDIKNIFYKFVYDNEELKALMQHWNI